MRGIFVFSLLMCSVSMVSSLKPAYRTIGVPVFGWKMTRCPSCARETMRSFSSGVRGCAFKMLGFRPLRANFPPRRCLVDVCLYHMVLQYVCQEVWLCLAGEDFGHLIEGLCEAALRGFGEVDAT